MLARLGRERRQGETRGEWLKWAVLSSVEELGGEWLRGAVIWTGRGHLGGEGVSNQGGQALEWDVQQACARGEELAGVRRPCGATALRTVGRTDELR